MGNPYFEFKQFKVYHDKCGMKVSTDACILGAYVREPEASRLLDIGAGSGLLSLMMAQNHAAADITAVELDASAFEQLLENVEKSAWSDRIRGYQGSVQEFARTNKEGFDLIISNPPFYPDHNKSSDEKRKQAFHTDELSFRDLARCASQLLTTEGTFYVLLPKRQSDEFRFVANTFDLFVQKKLSIRSKDGGKVIREIVCYGKERANEWKEEELVVYKELGVYTDAFIELLQPFYLYL